jgi:hypothetical protein
LLPQQVRDKVKPRLIVCVVVIHRGHCRLAMLFPAMQWHRMQAVKDGADNFRWCCNFPGSRQWRLLLGSSIHPACSTNSHGQMHLVHPMQQPPSAVRGVLAGGKATLTPLSGSVIHSVSLHCAPCNPDLRSAVSRFSFVTRLSGCHPLTFLSAP